MDKYAMLDYLIRPFGIFDLRKTEIPVIYYHSIVKEGGYSYAKTDLEVFKSHMQFLSDNNYKTLLFDEIPDGFRKDKKDKVVLITFDDGYRDNYDLIFDFMRERGLKYNIFLAGEKIGNDAEYLTWEQVKMMSESGLVGFGAHTYHHVDCTKVDNSNIDVEVNQTNELIEKHIGKPMTDFCFPYGYYDIETLNYFADKTDYKNIYTSNYRPVQKIKNCNARGRAAIENSDTVSRFKRKVTGKYNILYHLKYRRSEKDGNKRI